MQQKAADELRPVNEHAALAAVIVGAHAQANRAAGDAGNALKGKSLRPDKLAAIPAPDTTSTARGLSSQTVKTPRADRPPNPLRLASGGT